MNERNSDGINCQRPANGAISTGKRWKAGAGEGNRTLVVSLGSCCSTIELHPQIKHLADMRPGVLQSVLQHSLAETAGQCHDDGLIVNIMLAYLANLLLAPSHDISDVTIRERFCSLRHEARRKSAA